MTYESSIQLEFQKCSTDAMRDTPNAKNHNVNEVKNLELMGIQEMDAMEMKSVDGGILLTAACIGLAALYLAGTCCALSQGRNPHTGANM